MDQHQEEQKRVREAIDKAQALTVDDLKWKPYYPNNLLRCPQEGWYCIIQDEGADYATKYTILFQYYEDEDFLTHTDQGVELYVLCSKRYSGLNGPLSYPEPDMCFDAEKMGDINDFGSFFHAYPTLEQAKGKVLWQLRMQGYVLSHLLDENWTDTEDGGEEPK